MVAENRSATVAAIPLSLRAALGGPLHRDFPKIDTPTYARELLGIGIPIGSLRCCESKGMLS